MQIVYPPYSVRGGGGARIAVDYNNHLHVVWVDDRLFPGESTEIFYKRGENETGVDETTEYAKNNGLATTILNGPLLLPDGKNCRVFDITGRVVLHEKIKPGIYFFEIDGKIIRKVVKIK